MAEGATWVYVSICRQKLKYQGILPIFAAVRSKNNSNKERGMANIDNTVLIADIGGTNSRFALVQIDQNTDLTQGLQLEHLKIQPSESIDSIETAILTYIQDIPDCKVDTAVMVVAAPVIGENVRFSKFPWEFTVSGLAKKLSLSKLHILNDFAAIASAIPFLKPNSLMQLAGGKGDPNGPKIVLGPAAGLGVATVVPINGRWKVLPGEGGQIAFAPLNKMEVEVLKILQAKYTRVIYENILSMQGLVELYMAVGTVLGVKVPILEQVEITKQGQDKSNKHAVMAMEMFCEILGAFAGDMALTVNATGGVYLTGGVIDTLQGFFASSKFRERFESKGNVKFVKDIPSLQVIEPKTPLKGAELWAGQKFFNKEFFIV
jgi:glucokinase